MAKISNVAHRGVPPLAPENTLEGFAKAIELGADEVELDVRLSLDEEAVVIHDERIGKKAVRELTAGELKRWNVPVLAEALGFISGRVRVQIELKFSPSEPRDLASRVMDAVRRAEAAGWVRPISFHVAYLQRIRSLDRAISLGFLVSPQTEGDIAGWSDITRRLSPCLLLAHIDLLSPEMMGKLRDRGIEAGAWGLGVDPAKMQKASSLDLVCATSDRPDLLRPFLK